MPKIIENLRHRILVTARHQLMEHGYAGLAIRSVAAESGIATGTMYNYYPGKDMLVASVMLEDWLAIADSMRKGCNAAQDVRGGLRAVYDGLVSFRLMYEDVWSDYSFTGSTRSIYKDRHVQLISQLSEILGGLFSRFCATQECYRDTFIAQSILTAATQGDPFDKYADIIGRIMDKE